MLGLYVIDRIESQHMPLSLKLALSMNTRNNKTQQETIIAEKFVWDDVYSNIYSDNLNDAHAREKLEQAILVIETDVDLAINIFNDMIKNAAACMKKRYPIGVNKQRDWYDSECKEARKDVRKKLKLYRRTLCANDRHEFCKARREYKHLLTRKKKKHNSSMIQMLVSNVHNQKNFWNTVQKVIPKQKMVKNEITVQEWFTHFKELLEKEELPQLEGDMDESENEDCFLNQPITREEVTRAIQKLKLNKAAGPDGIIGELFKYAQSFIISFFVIFFNALFDKGVFPVNWSESIVLPLFKKGDVNNPGNYRGICLTDVSSKLYCTIINARLQTWVATYNITGEYQAGFKKGYSTIDHMFTLMSCIQKQFCMNRKLYVAFIDFEKAFDSINRQCLWPILIKQGVKGKLFRSIRSMYENVKVKIRCGASFTDYIHCSTGLKQGDAISPVLFSIYINELAMEIINNGRHGVTFPSGMLELFILLLADDIVLMSETIVGLQTQLNSLQRAALNLNLKVNMNKSNILVFRKGGYLEVREKWFFNGSEMQVVNAYRYLGIYFSTKLSFSTACKDIASKAKKALLAIMQKLHALNNNSVTVFLKLFDVQVCSIVQYGSEIWGLDNVAEEGEKLNKLKKEN